MNKKIAIILALMITSTTSLFGCNTKAKTDSSSSAANDTAFEVNSSKEETADTDDDLNKNDAAESETEKINTNSTNNDTQSNSASSNTSNSKNKSENKSTQSSSSKSTSGKKSENVNKSKNTNNSAENNEKPVSKKATTYTSKSGYSLTFPSNWAGKYEVKETADALTVNYKCSKDKTSKNPYLFSIEKVKPNENYDHFDKVGNIRTFNVGNTKYIVGGPTDVRLGENSKDFKDYIAINKQCPDVVNSIKVKK